jgi:alpha-ketoglutarate-dependent taurine dioxygenase
MVIELTEAEYKLLEQVLREHQRVLLRDIAHTDHKDYRLRLRDEERVTELLLEKLGMRETVKA